MEIVMGRERFKDWFKWFSPLFDVEVEFRKIDTNYPHDSDTMVRVGEYNVLDNSLWIAEEWADCYLPTRYLIYFSFHELAHRIQLLHGYMDLNEEGLVPQDQIPDLEESAHKFARTVTEVFTGKPMHYKDGDTVELYNF
jgi:hypothetical protein